MRRGELFHAHTPSSLTYRKRNRIIRRTFRFPFLLPFPPFFFAAFPRVRPSLNSPFVFLPRVRVRALVIYLGTTLPSIAIQLGYSPATLFFLTFLCARPRRRRRRRENVVPASLPAMFLRTTIERYRREFTSQNTTAESYQR